MYKNMKIIHFDATTGRKTHVGEQWDMSLGPEFEILTSPRCVGFILLAGGRY